MMGQLFLPLLFQLLLPLLLLPRTATANHKRDCQGFADVGNYFINYCEEKCVCELITSTGYYDHVCYREREELTCMSSSRRKRFYKAYKAVTTPGNPQYSQMKALLETHGGSNFNVIHTAEWFLPWHRWYLKSVEDILRNEDCRVTIPWWRWSKKSTTWWQGSPFLASASWIGTNSEGGCVDDGAFAHPAWAPPTGGSSTCLRREFWGGFGVPDYSAFPTSTLINNVLNYPPIGSDAYEDFSDALETMVHNTAHFYIYGDMATALSPRDPVFFLHHAYIDKLWDQWQKKSSDHMASYLTGSSMATTMPYTVGGGVNTVGGNFDLKQDHGAIYVSVKSSNSGPGHFSFLHRCLWVRLNALHIRQPLLMNLDGILDALDSAEDASFKSVPQLRPETPDFRTLKRRYNWRYELAGRDIKAIRMLDNKFKKEVEMKRTYAESVNGIGKKGLAKFKNPASRMLGFDLDSDEVQEALKSQHICPVGQKYSTKTKKCIKDKYATMEMQKILMGTAFSGGEVVSKKDLPPEMFQRKQGLLRSVHHKRRVLPYLRG